MTGKTHKAKTEFKVVILGNFKSSDPLYQDQYYRDGYYYYKPGEFNPYAETTKYLPLWGELVSFHVLQPGTNTFIGTVLLQRALSKVHIQLSEQSTNFELLGVTMNYYKDRGYTVPNTGLLHLPNVPTHSNTFKDAPFHKVDNSNCVIYLPEYENKSPEQLSMKIKLRDKSGTVYERDLPFGEYVNNVFVDKLDLMRNSYYKFNIDVRITKSSGFDLDISSENIAFN